MERSFIVASFIILITLTTVNNLAEPDFKLFFDSDEIDLDIYSSEDSFLTISDDVKDLIASSESEMDYDQSSVNPSKKIQFRQGIMNIMQQSGGGSQSVGIAGFGFGFPFTGSGGGFPFTGSGGGSPNTGYERTCPFGFTRFNDICYYLSTERALWEESIRNCRNMGAELVSIVTETEWNNVKAFIASKGPAAYNEPACPNLSDQYPKNIFRVWTSGNDIEREGNFIWKGKNVEVKNGYTHWCPGEPNNEVLTKSPGEDCMEIWFNTVNSASSCWNDLHCDISCKTQYLCVKRL